MFTINSFGATVFSRVTSYRTMIVFDPFVIGTAPPLSFATSPRLRAPLRLSRDVPAVLTFPAV